MIDMSDDRRFLTSATRPDYELLPDPLRVVDLFSGAGGLTLGLAEAAMRLGRGTDVTLAVDFDPHAATVFAANFPKARVECAPVETIFDGALGSPATAVERRWRSRVGDVDWLHGGPPCQGHSDLNNHTRRRDSRNRLYERMARAAEVLQPRVVVVENVPPVKNDRYRVVERTVRALEIAGYRVAGRVVTLDDLGVPQRRRRHTILGTKSLDVDPEAILATLGGGSRHDLRWAIADLEDASKTPLDVPSRPSPENRRRIDYLFAADADPEEKRYDLPNELRPPCHQGDHSYKSMYGRLRWDEPAQTITSGFGSMGQGRFVHPSRRRTLTPHEAARLQFFPDWFDFTAAGSVMKRGAWATMIGNAVPPKLTMTLGEHLLPYLARPHGGAAGTLHAR